MGVIKDWDFFWHNRHDFHLGSLATEMPHINTIGLAETANESVDKAIDMIRDVDLEMLHKLKNFQPQAMALSTQIRQVLSAGGRIFISGCGATGRLAIVLEKLWRLEVNDKNKDCVIGFMAGGDAALVKSIEGFEDHPEYAGAHIKELGFGEKDLLLAVTEGGETPFVLATVEAALKISRQMPWLIYCNSDHSLRSVRRSWDLISNSGVRSISLETGSMALTGSTRMQATTAQMLFIASALFEVDLQNEINNLIDVLHAVDQKMQASLIETEAHTYKQGGYISYICDHVNGLTVLTDTTERAPTFSLTPFENVFGDDRPCLCYLIVEDAQTTEAAWNKILGRLPRTLEWSFCCSNTGLERLYGFDISKATLTRRQRYNNHLLFSIKADNGIYSLDLQHQHLNLDGRKLSLSGAQALLKIILNTHSTLVAALLGRYQSNIMSYVSPANNKLIDRAIRYVQYLLAQNHQNDIAYDEIALMLYKVSLDMPPTDSIVIHTYEALCRR
ncbi:MAG: hypothetical protein ACO2ZM_04760 [Francisellaceae bacterium]